MCKMDKIFLRAPLVPTEHRAAPLATNCWPEAPFGGAGGGGGVGVLEPADAPVGHPPPPPPPMACMGGVRSTRECG